MKDEVYPYQTASSFRLALIRHSFIFKTLVDVLRDKYEIVPKKSTTIQSGSLQENTLLRKLSPLSEKLDLDGRDLIHVLYCETADPRDILLNVVLDRYDLVSRYIAMPTPLFPLTEGVYIRVYKDMPHSTLLKQFKEAERLVATYRSQDIYGKRDQVAARDLQLVGLYSAIEDRLKIKSVLGKFPRKITIPTNAIHDAIAEISEEGVFRYEDTNGDFSDLEEEEKILSTTKKIRNIYDSLVHRYSLPRPSRINSFLKLISE